MESAAIIGAAIAASKLDYCNSLFIGASAAQLHRLQRGKIHLLESSTEFRVVHTTLLLSSAFTGYHYAFEYNFNMHCWRGKLCNWSKLPILLILLRFDVMHENVMSANVVQLSSISRMLPHVLMNDLFIMLLLIFGTGCQQTLFHRPHWLFLKVV